MATTVVNNNVFWGMVIYTITGDGTLTGTWKNNRLSNDSILGEIARKNDNSTGIAGVYTASWIEENNNPHNATITITPIENDTAWSFEWREINTSTMVFRGMGMTIGTNQIAVVYWGPENALSLRF